MKRAFCPPVFGIFGIGFLLAPTMAGATEARVVSVRRGSGGGPALLLKVADGATLSTQDVSALLDAAGSGGGAGSSRKVKAAVHGRRFGRMAVVAPTDAQAAPPVRKQVAPSVARAAKKPATPPAARPVTPDVTIFDPNEPAKPASPPPPAGAPPEPKKQP